MKRIKDLMAQDRPLKWLFYGDSITHGSVYTFGCRDYTELFSERVRTELGRNMDVVINTAISGHNTENLIEGFDWRVKQFAPDVVFLMIGMNDCSSDLKELTVEKFGENLKTLCDSCKELGSIVVLQTTSAIFPNTAPDRIDNLPKYMQMLRDVAEQENLLLVDHAKYWEENTEKHYLWMANEFHPNQYGHRVFVRELLKTLDLFDAESSVCRFFVP